MPRKKSPRRSELARTQDVLEGTVSLGVVAKLIESGAAVLLRGRSNPVAVGKNLLVKVNTNLGVNAARRVNVEIQKADAIAQVGYRPDTVMDLSITRTKPPLYGYLLDQFRGPVGTLPHYLCYRPRKGIDPRELLEEISAQASTGVAWFTLHPTPRKELYELAQSTRLIPCTSRGGGIVIEDMYLSNRSESIISSLFDEILRILRRHSVVLSVGTAFRPATVIDALDKVHRTEIQLQSEYVEAARRAGVAVMMEGVGHIDLHRLRGYVRLVSSLRVPFIPLGPIPTDAAVGEDHIASAIGAAYMALLGGADMINSVTREEHTGRVPSKESILEGIRAARIAAHTVNTARFGDSLADKDTAGKRAKNYTCVVEGGLFTQSSKTRFSMGCDRCGPQCPLIVNFKVDQGRLDPDPVSRTPRL